MEPGKAKDGTPSQLVKKDVVIEGKKSTQSEIAAFRDCKPQY